MKFFHSLKLQALAAVLAVSAMLATGAGMLAGGVPALTTVAAVSVMAGYASQADAATTNYGTGVPMVLVPVRIASAGASVTASARMLMPFRARLVGASAAARSGSGTAPTLTVDVLSAGTTLLSAPISVTAGASVEATIATATVADESSLTINLAVGGTTPLWQDVDVLLTFVRY